MFHPEAAATADEAMLQQDQPNPAALLQEATLLPTLLPILLPIHPQVQAEALVAVVVVAAEAQVPEAAVVAVVVVSNNPG